VTAAAASPATAITSITTITTSLVGIRCVSVQQYTPGESDLAVPGYLEDLNLHFVSDVQHVLGPIDPPDVDFGDVKEPVLVRKTNAPNSAVRRTRPS